MITSIWKTSDALDHRLPNNDDDSLLNRLGLKTVLVFCSSRALRGGPRLVVQIALFLFAILFFLRLSPGESGEWNILPWGTPTPSVGDLRIVVFGSPDLAGSVVDAGGITWTEQLCKELNCSSHISLVPAGSHALASNSIYANELDKLQNVTNGIDLAAKPGLNYEFVGEQYPAPVDTPDLAMQIEQFLAMPVPKDPPRETLWIFTFGTWEIWNLASMPKTSGDAVVDATIAHIFDQVEMLYRMALDPTSVAFSDFWSNATDAQIAKLTAPDAPARVDIRKLESFRVLIPQLFDISLAPGWHERPVPPSPNNMAEQMRTAAALTSRWNWHLRSTIDEWNAKGGAKPEAWSSEPDQLVEVVESNTLLKYMPAALRPSLHSEGTEEEPDPIIYAPYPQRNAWHTNPAALMLNAMTEEEMQRGGNRDSKGRGTRSTNDTMRYLDVWTPCVRSIDGRAPKECQDAENHLFFKPFNVGARATVELGKAAANDVLDHLFMRDEEKPGWLY